SGGAARLPRGDRASPARRRDPAAARLRAAPRENPQAPRFRAAADDPLALAQAGGVQPEQPGPFRPRVRLVRAFHFADPPLPGSPRAPRHQSRSFKTEIYRYRVGSDRSALLRERAPRRRREPRRRELPPVLLHARTRRRPV